MHPVGMRIVSIVRPVVPILSLPARDRIFGLILGGKCGKLGKVERMLDIVRQPAGARNE